MRPSNKLYDYKSVEDFIQNKLIPNGYEVERIEGCLCDNYVCYAPDDKHYNFVFLERYLNEWSSAMTMNRYTRIPKSVCAQLDVLRGDVECNLELTEPPTGMFNMEGWE